MKNIVLGVIVASSPLIAVAFVPKHGIYFNPTPNDPNLEDMETINRLKLLGR